MVGHGADFTDSLSQLTSLWRDSLTNTDTPVVEES